MISLSMAVERPWIQDHDRNLTVVLQRAQEVGLKLNMDKSKLCQTEVKYMGSILTAEWLRPDPEKVSAITNMKRPENVKAVQRFIDLATYLSRFLPHLSETCEPLRRLKTKEPFGQGNLSRKKHSKMSNVSWVINLYWSTTKSMKKSQSSVMLGKLD